MANPLPAYLKSIGLKPKTVGDPDPINTGQADLVIDHTDTLLAQLRQHIATAATPGLSRVPLGHAVASIRDVLNRLAPYRELAVGHGLTALLERLDFEVSRAGLILRRVER